MPPALLLLDAGRRDRAANLHPQPKGLPDGAPQPELVPELPLKKLENFWCTLREPHLGHSSCSALMKPVENTSKA
jgi:hypothetical protein